MRSIVQSEALRIVTGQFGVALPELPRAAASPSIPAMLASESAASSYGSTLSTRRLRTSMPDPAKCGTQGPWRIRGAPGRTNVSRRSKHDDGPAPKAAIKGDGASARNGDCATKVAQASVSFVAGAAITHILKIGSRRRAEHRPESRSVPGRLRYYDGDGDRCAVSANSQVANFCASAVRSAVPT